MSDVLPPAAQILNAMGSVMASRYITGRSTPVAPASLPDTPPSEEGRSDD